MSTSRQKSNREYQIHCVCWSCHLCEIHPFQCFRLTLYQIQIGPYAAKTGAKPNTIIKRLAGIKARNGLNISTTLGNYKRPSAPDEGKFKAESKQKSAKKEQQHEGDDHHGKAVAKNEGREAGYGADDSSEPGFDFGKGLPTPTASPSSSNASSGIFYQHPHYHPSQYTQPGLGSGNPASSHTKRTFQETVELESESSDLDGTAWKRVKVE